MLSGPLPCDLLLDVFFVGLSKQVEKTAGEVVSVGVGVSQLVGDAVEEEIPSLSVHVHRQVLEDVHVTAVCDGANAGTLTLGSDVLDGLSTDIPRNNSYL